MFNLICCTFKNSVISGSRLTWKYNAIKMLIQQTILNYTAAQKTLLSSFCLVNNKK